MADNLNTMLTISEALNDEVIPNALTAENYQNDGPDFVKTRKILKNTQDKLSASKELMIRIILIYIKKWWEKKVRLMILKKILTI